MKSLYLWRHAKSDWGSIDLDDHDRALTPRGNKDAPRMATAMKERGFLPDKIYCSTARRTRQTLNLFQNVMGTDIPVALDRNLYLASPQALLKMARSTDDDLSSVLIIAHNPGLEDLAASLCSPESGTTPNFPTAGFAAFAFQIDHWKYLEAEAGTLLEFLTPKKLSV